MESKHAMVDKAASILTAESFFDAYRKRDFNKMVAYCTPEGELQYVPLGNQGEGKIGTTGRTVWSGLFDAVPDLTNRVDKILDMQPATDYLLFTKAIHSRFRSCCTSLLGGDHHD